MDLFPRVPAWMSNRASPSTDVDAADYDKDGTLAVHKYGRASSVTEEDITRGCAEPGTPDLLTP